MSIDLKYNKQKKILTIKAQGYLSVESFETVTLALLSSDEYCHDVDTIWDIRDMHFDNIDMTFLKQLNKVQKKYAERRGEARIAIFSNSKLAVPIVKLFMIISKNLSQKYNVFTSVEEAELWLQQNSLRN